MKKNFWKNHFLQLGGAFASCFLLCTGVVYGESELKKIADLVEKNTCESLYEADSLARKVDKEALSEKQREAFRVVMKTARLGLERCKKFVDQSGSTGGVSGPVGIVNGDKAEAALQAETRPRLDF